MKVLRWVFVLIVGGAAAFTFLAYLGMGIAAGDLVGVSGRAADVAVIQHRAEYWLLSFALLQLLLIVALYSSLSFGKDAAVVSRLLARGVVAVLM